MPDEQKLETAVRDLLLDLCEVMYSRGFDQVPVGAMMRLVGVPAERASLHDADIFQLDQEFLEMLAQRDREKQNKNKNKKKTIRQPAPDGVTLH